MILHISAHHDREKAQMEGEKSKHPTLFIEEFHKSKLNGEQTIKKVYKKKL